MKDKIYLAIVVVLGFIVALLVVWFALMTSTPRKVDCDAITNPPEGSDYRPIPKQCKKGE